jgi:transcriptional regulator with XRE-family HTH domain
MSDRSDRLRQARIAAGFESAAAAADRFGWSENTYKSNENGHAPFSFRKAKEYAKAFGVRAEWLYDASGTAHGPPSGVAEPDRPFPRESVPGDPINLADVRAFVAEQTARPKPALAGRSRAVERRIPVAGDVAAGVWKEAHRLAPEDHDYLPMDVAGYERATLRAWRLVGPSMNLVYPEGRYVITAHPAEAGLRSGDYVIVERRKLDVVEVTCKEFVQEPDGRIALWPRSSHPDFQEPIYLREVHTEDDVDQTAPQIVGVVVADYSKRTRPPYPYR